MPNGLVVLCGGVPFAFLGDDMQHFRCSVVLDLTQNAHQALYIVPVCGAEITDVQSREDVISLLAESGFPVVIATQQSTAFSFVNEV